MTTPAARGLFARAIAQSPPADAAYPGEQTAAWAAEFVGELRRVVSRPTTDRPAFSPIGRSIRPAPTGGAPAADDALRARPRAPGPLSLLRNAIPRSAAPPIRVAAPAQEHQAAVRWESTEREDDVRGQTAASVAGGLTPGLAARLTAAELLTTASATDLTLAALALQVRTPDSTPGTFCLAPVVDGEFLPERPLNAFRSGRAHAVPLIIGTNDREGSIFRGRADVLPRTPGRIRALFQQAPAPSREAMREAYPGLPITRAAADFGGDYAFWYPSVTVADRHSRHAPVHVYRFDNAPRLVHLLGLDATHGIELYALFSPENTRVARTMTSLGGRKPFTHAGERMRRHWLRFACTGSVDGSWPGYDEHDRLTLIIDDVDRIESDPRGDRRRAWQAFRPGL
ncbi:hypothetical protein D6T64_01720 [Cryobacterium melibiosiphilum]|uniref:Carboxylesterase type B domain-containing protein n=2 Tax=Cryobacterium melibiosiphilum TaxID=995039 RepID=A0A3A5MQP2_9MICO|nr:hypothetical protein D6T64_01720 [Cryobacterium melibiosiphilum]